MIDWSAFAAAAPDLARTGRQLLHQHGLGLAFLATVRADGAPRLHPICPFILEDRLLGFIVPSPKQRDLQRDGRYALHALQAADSDDEFCLMGRAQPVTDARLRERAAAAYHIPVEPSHQLFEFLVERALHTHYDFRGQWPAHHDVWREL
jgi:hypothetical protein